MQYFISTSYILFWCALCSVIAAFFFYYSSWFIRIISRQTILLPALCLSPVVIFISFVFFKQNLIFPSFYTSSEYERFLYSSTCGIIIFLSSGLFAQLAQKILLEQEYWQKKPFVIFAEAMGRSSQKELLRLVLSVSLLDSYLRCLPVLMGELLIVEVMFNSSGLGHKLWFLAKEHQLYEISLYLMGYGLMFWIFSQILKLIKKNIGQKLASYH